jgi:hypothetical protein
VNYETGKVWTKRKRRHKGIQKAINKGKKGGNDALDTRRDPSVFPYFVLVGKINME